MTVFTIVYNGYGKFLPHWLYCIKKQSLQPKEIIVVLGKNHGVTERPDNVRFIECDSDVMGTLRNVAIKNKRFKKCLYFSADDELLPNAIMAIEKKFSQGYQVVGLKYNDLITIGNKTTANGKTTAIYAGSVRNSYLPEDTRQWRKSNIPGWVAVNGTYEYEEIEIPNYPYLFKLKSLELPMAQTDEIVANYKRRKGSHGDIAKEGNFQNKFVQEINKWVEIYR